MKLYSPQIHQKLALLCNQPVSLSPTLIQIPDGLLFLPHLCSSLLPVSQSSPPQQAAALSPKISCAESCHQLFCLTHSSVWAPSLKAKTSEDEALQSQQELFQHVWCSIHGISLGSTADREKSDCPEDILKLSSSSCWLIPILRKTSREIFSYNFKSNVEVFSPTTCEAFLKQNCSHNSINVCLSN